MHDERSHPFLQQTPLTVNPFIDLPKPPTLPHNYASLPSTLPPSSISAAPSASNPDLPAYVTSPSGFAAHPSSIIAQNKTLLKQLEDQQKDATAKIKTWEDGIRDRELAEKRRKAPGYLDSESKLLQPERPSSLTSGTLMDRPTQPHAGQLPQTKDKDVDDLGDAIDRAFGRSEMG